MAVRRLQVDSPLLRHTSSLGKYIVRLYIDTDDFDTLRQQTQYTAADHACTSIDDTLQDPCILYT